MQRPMKTWTRKSLLCPKVLMRSVLSIALRCDHRLTSAWFFLFLVQSGESDSDWGSTSEASTSSSEEEGGGGFHYTAEYFLKK